MMTVPPMLAPRGGVAYVGMRRGLRVSIVVFLFVCYYNG